MPQGADEHAGGEVPHLPCHLGHLGQSAVMKEEGKEIKGCTRTEKNSEGSKKKHRNKTLFEFGEETLFICDQCSFKTNNLRNL